MILRSSGSEEASGRLPETVVNGRAVNKKFTLWRALDNRQLIILFGSLCSFILSFIPCSVGLGMKTVSCTSEYGVWR